MKNNTVHLKSVTILLILILFVSLCPVSVSTQRGEETWSEICITENNDNTITQAPEEASNEVGSTETPKEVMQSNADEGEDPLLLSNVVESPESPLEQKGFFQTGLFTGSASFRYPIDVPQGTNDLTPAVALSYDSHSAKGRAGLVGLGWSLNLNYVKRDVNSTPDNISDDIFKMVLNGQSYDLVYVPSEGRYHTEIESYLYTEKLNDSPENEKGEYWLVRTKDGTKYRFGYRDDSETASSVRDHVRQWNLDEVEDTHGNHIYYYYSEDPAPNDIGTAYPARIKYNNDQKRVIQFVLGDTDRPDAITVYDQGSKIKQTRRLKEIRVLADNNLVRKYSVNYSMNQVSTRSLLSSITEYGADNSSSLPPTEFIYKEVRIGWQRDDSWELPISVGIAGARIADVNGDGLPDILRGYKVDRDIIYYDARVNTGDGWEEDDGWLPPTYFTEELSSGSKTTAALMDANGDGLVDIVSGYEGIWLNTGSGWQKDNSWVSKINMWTERGVRVIDVNGDGLPDILRGYSFDRPEFVSEAWINTGNGWEEDDSWLPPTYFNRKYGDGSRTGAVPMDANGDGLVDIVFNYEHTAWLNTGSGWQEDNSWTPPTHLMGEFGMQISDVNGDGLPDILKGYKVDRDIIYYDAWVNTGDGWEEDDGWLPPTYFCVQRSSGGSRTWSVLMDANGDGLVDIVSHPMRSTWLNNHNDPTPYLLKQVKTSGGGFIDISYQPSTKFDNPDLGLVYRCVESVTRDNGMNDSHRLVTTHTYNYSNGLYDYEDREFRGFGHVTVTDPVNTTTEHWFHQDDALKGKEYQTQISDEAGNLYTKTEHEWSYTEENGIYGTFLDLSSDYTYDGISENPKLTQTRFEYDDYGNVEKTSYDGDIDVSGDERYLYNKYAYNPTLWIVDKIKRTYLLNSDFITINETMYYYDNHNHTDPPTKGDLTKEVFWLESGTNPMNTYEYDPYGNMIEATDANGHITRYIYGVTDTTYTFLERIINAKGHEYEYVYDLGTGNLLSSIDPNGYETSYEYDTFGRPLKEICPYDTSGYPTISYEYYQDGIAPEGLKVSRRELNGQSNTIDSHLFVDGFGQQIQTRVDAEDSSEEIVTSTFYDELGRVNKESIPYYDAYSASYTTPPSVRGTSYEYDSIGRNTLIENPDETTRTIEYDHWVKTTTDENDNQIIFHSDAYDRIVKVEERNEEETYTTIYDYNARDELIKITDHEGNEFNYNYDTLGRKISQHDPDMGDWTYSYDLNGNLISQTDARGTTTMFQYDKLDRIEKQDYPNDPDIDYVYDLETRGTLSGVSDSLGTTHYYYDNRLRKVKEEKTLDGRTWITQWTYDSADRITSVLYPTGEVVSYTYNNQGLLDSISSSVDNIDYNEMGKITRKDFKNAVFTTLEYNVSHQRLQRIYTSGLQDFTYYYDNVGNIISIEDDIEGKIQNFGYDDLNRLIRAEEQSGYGLRNYSYNPIGNLIELHMPGINLTFRYGEGTAGPHAVTTRLMYAQSTLYYPDFTDTDTPGSWRTWIGVMNTGDANTTLNLAIYNQDGSLAYSNPDFVTLEPKAAHFFRPGKTAGIAQGSTIVSGANLAGTCHESKNDGDGAKVYTAVTCSSPTLYYPDFTDTDTIGNWRTWMGVVNAGDTSTTVRLDVYNADGSLAYSNPNFVTLEPKAAHFFRPGITAGIAQGCVVVSGANLAGTCHVNKNGGEGTKVYTALTSGSSTLYYPDFTDTDTIGNWRTWLGVMNTGDTNTTLNLTIYHPDGSLAYSNANFITLEPKAAHFFRPGITAGIAQGDVVVYGDNLAGTCHVNKNGGESTKVYTALASDSSTLYYPDFTDTDTSGNWRTWIAVMNTGATSTTVRLDVYNADGSLAYSNPNFVTLEPKAAHFFRPGITAGIAQGDAVVSGDNLAGTCHVNKNGGEGTKVYTAIGG